VASPVYFKAHPKPRQPQDLLMVRAALDGVGIAFALEEQVAPHLTRRRLVRVLDDYRA